MCFLNQKGRVEAMERRRYPVRQRADRLFSHAGAVRARQQPVGLGLRRRQMSRNRTGCPTLQRRGSRREVEEV